MKSVNWIFCYLDMLCSMDMLQSKMAQVKCRVIVLYLEVHDSHTLISAPFKIGSVGLYFFQIRCNILRNV